MTSFAIFLPLENSICLPSCNQLSLIVPHLCAGLLSAAWRGWLSALPLEQYGFALHKGEFIDAICLHYGFTPSLLPSHCVCGKDFTLSHTLSCPHGAFPIIRHNEVRDLTASLMTEVCHDVQVEPHLHALSGEVMHHRSAVLDDNARVDIRASGF